MFNEFYSLVRIDRNAALRYQMFITEDKNDIVCSGKVTAHILSASDCIINKTVERVISDIRCIENLAGRPVKDLEL